MYIRIVIAIGSKQYNSYMPICTLQIICVTLCFISDAQSHNQSSRLALVQSEAEKSKAPCPIDKYTFDYSANHSQSDQPTNQIRNLTCLVPNFVVGIASRLMPNTKSSFEMFCFGLHLTLFVINFIVCSMCTIPLFCLFFFAVGWYTIFFSVAFVTRRITDNNHKTHLLYTNGNGENVCCHRLELSLCNTFIRNYSSHTNQIQAIQYTNCECAWGFSFVQEEWNRTGV